MACLCLLAAGLSVVDNVEHVPEARHNCAHDAVAAPPSEVDKGVGGIQWRARNGQRALYRPEEHTRVQQFNGETRGAGPSRWSTS